jgi:hypothetical protein
MKTSNRHWLPGAIGALVGIGVVATFGDGVVPADSEALQQTLVAGASIGRAIIEFIGLGFALGLVAFGLRQLANARAADRGARAPAVAMQEQPVLVPVLFASLPPGADATASEFDDIARPVFAPITSLTEAQVERERARRRHEERSAAKKGA